MAIFKVNWIAKKIAIIPVYEICQNQEVAVKLRKDIFRYILDPL